MFMYLENIFMNSKIVHDLQKMFSSSEFFTGLKKIHDSEIGINEKKT